MSKSKQQDKLVEQEKPAEEEKKEELAGQSNENEENNGEEEKEEEENIKEVEVPITVMLSRQHLVPLSRQDFSMDEIKKWSRLIARSPPKRRSSHSSFIYKDTYLYIIGGVDITERKQNDIFKLDLTSADPQWELVIPEENPLEKIAYHAGVECNGIYYIIGGQDSSLNSSNKIQKFNIKENKILDPVVPEEADFPPIESHTANLHGTNIIIYGGNTNKKYNNHVYSYDTTNDIITKLTPDDIPEENMPKPRQEHCAIIFQDNLYIYGGYGPDEIYYSDMWMFDLNGKTFTEIQFANDIENEPMSIPVGRSGHCMVEMNGAFYIFGGKLGLIKESNELWKFDPGEKKFEIIHDTLIEQFTQEELERTKFISSDLKAKKSFRLLTRHEVEQRKNPLPYNLKNSKIGGKQKNKEEKKQKNTSFTEVKNPNSNEVLSRPNVTKMKKSLIYTSSNDELNVALNKLAEDEKAMLDKESTLIIGDVPEPRDGLTLEVFRGGKLVLFGGDRNKFPFNDLYYYNPNGEENRNEEEEEKKGDNDEEQGEMNNQGVA